MKKHSYFFILCGLIFLSLAKPTKDKPRKAKDYALFFAVNDYTDKRLEKLKNPISDATNIAVVLHDQYGFETEVVKNPTLNDIQRKLEEYRQNFASGQWQSDGQLLIYFTGHGSVEDETGYFLPADVQSDKLIITALAYPTWRKKIAKFKCKHILVTLDACYSGTFDPDFETKKTDPLWGDNGKTLNDTEDLLNYNAKFQARFFFTSTSDDRTTPDQSTFAQKFLEGLLGKFSDDGILTNDELWFNYLKQARPKPRVGNFEDNQADANFLFIAKKGQNTEGVKSVTTDREAWQNAQKQDNLLAYQNYLRQFPRGDFADDAKEKIHQLEQQEEDNAWAFAKSQNTIDGFNRFLSRYPSSIYANRARQLIKGLGFAFEPETVTVRGGTFQMGQSDPDIGSSGNSKDEQPVHSVTVSNFLMSKYEITVTQFKAFVDDTGYQTDAEKEGFSYKWNGKEWEKTNGVNWKCDAEGNIRPQSDYNHPVIHVSWNDADAYCKWLSRKTGKSYRLPTEAEWEYAAGNGSRHTKYSWGNGDPSGKNGGNVADETAKKTFSTFTIFGGYTDGYVYTAPVGQYNANDFGLFDMTGNVWEWCSDWYSNYSSTAVSNPTGAVTGSRRVIRGGSWFNDPVYCRVANRSYFAPTLRDSNLGFRVVSPLQ